MSNKKKMEVLYFVEQYIKRYATALFCKCSPEGWMEAGTYQSSAWASKYRNNNEIFKYIGSGVDGCQ